MSRKVDMFHLAQMLALLSIFAILSGYVIVRLRAGQAQKRWVARIGIGGAILGIVSTVLVLAFFNPPQRTPLLLLFPGSLMVLAALNLLIFCHKQVGSGRASAYRMSVACLLLASTNFMLMWLHILDNGEVTGLFIGIWAAHVGWGIVFVFVALGRALFDLVQHKRHTTTLA